MQSNRQKIDLYILSLGILFVFFIILSFRIPEGNLSSNELEFNFIFTIVKDNYISLLSILMLLYSIFIYVKLKISLNSATDIPFTIKEIENANYEHLVFLATYIIPLVSFDFENNRQLLILLTLLIVMGVIYIKTDLFYANPSLALLGFKIYKVNAHFKVGDRNNIIVITKDTLLGNDKVTYIKLDDRIFYGKKLR